MSKRFTVTEKWEDSWFWQLKPNEKLLWNYLCDKCDLAGFWEVNLELASVQTKIPKRAILGAVQGLSRGYLTNGKYIWLRKFIYHQSNYPLNPANNAHKHILALLGRHSDFDVDFFQEMSKNFSPSSGPKEGLLSPSSKGSGSGKGKGKGKSKKENGFFNKFWSLYPKKVGKGDAEKSFLKANPSEELFVAMLSAVSEQKLSDQWKREDGRYVPNPATWLNQKRWGDVLSHKETFAEQGERLKAEGRL